MMMDLLLDMSYFKNLVTWMEELSVRDAVVFQGLRGLVSTVCTVV